MGDRESPRELVRANKIAMPDNKVSYGATDEAGIFISGAKLMLNTGSAIETVTSA